MRCPASCQIPLDILAQNIAFEIDRIPGLAVANVRVLESVRNDGDFDDAIVPAGDGQADSVDGDRAFWHDVACEVLRDVHAVQPAFTVTLQTRDPTRSIYVAQNKVAAKFFPCGERMLEIYARTLFQCAAVCTEGSLANGFA
jgi:hypothetical protein